MTKYQIFGSETSIDLDVCFFVDTIKSTAENHAKVAELVAQTQFDTDKKVNANLAVVQDGIVLDCFKGIKDELNNSLYETYYLHVQPYESLVTKMVDRDVDLKMIRCARTVVSYFTRTHLRTAAKEALGSDFESKINFLKTIKLNQFTDFGKHGTPIEIYKSIAFQLGQTLALMDDLEVFTKESIAIAYPTLEPYLQRKPVSVFKLQEALEYFVKLSVAYLPKMVKTVENG